MTYERQETHEDWIRLSDAMFARLGIKEDKKVKRSRMGTTIAFTPLFSVSKARERRARQQQLRSTNVTPHLEDPQSNTKNPGKVSE
jgi:hypothetical protein